MGGSSNRTDGVRSFVRTNEQKSLANRERRTEVPAHFVKQVFTILWIIYRAVPCHSMPFHANEPWTIVYTHGVYTYTPSEKEEARTKRKIGERMNQSIILIDRRAGMQ